MPETRTWQNTMTGSAAAELTELFGFGIPQRVQEKHYFRKHGPGAYYGQN